jgi:general secretion pathway protein A
VSTRPVEAPVDAAPWERFYGLGARAFSLTPDLRFAFHSRSHSHAIQQLTDALRRREGMIVVTGEIGTGKTMLCRTLLQTFETRTFVSVILDPRLGVDDLLQQILADFGLIPRPEPGTIAPPIATRHQMVTMLQRFLSTLIPLNAHAVVIVDEAQQVDPAVLEQLRLLTNFETDAAKLLQVVLVAQPDLDQVLGRPEMRQLAQRVARRIELYPLSELEVQRYVERRLLVASEARAATAVAGGAEPAGTGPQFTAAAFRTIAFVSGGIPRVINTLCDRALEIGFERKTFLIDDDIVSAAAARLRLSGEPRAPIAAPAEDLFRIGEPREPQEPRDEEASERDRGRSRPWVWAAALVLVLAGAGSLWMTGRFRSARARGGEAAPQVLPPSPAKPATSVDASPATGSASAPPAPAAAASAPPLDAPASPPPASSAAPAVPSGSAAKGTYYVAVAAFRTIQRASEVVEALTAAGLQASIREAPAGSWQQVVVGPFVSSQDAATAQPALSRLGFQATRIISEAPAR